MAFPDAEPNSQASPPLQGSVYGGHAPLVGARVYVLTPSTIGYGGAGIAATDTPSTGTPTGGNRSTSLMCGDAPAGGKCAGTGSTIGKNGQFGYHYVTTDNSGAFNLGGDYSCSVNQAVYIIATGGSPSYPGTTNAFITNAASFISNGNSTATYTFTTTTTENFYVGETVSVTGYPTAPYNGKSGTVIASGLTTNTFSFVAAYNGNATSGTDNTDSGVVTANPAANPNTINMAAVGICPSSGSFAGSVSYIYMNEVSTAALAYGLAGFGTDPFHIGVATGSGSDAATNSYRSAAYALNAMKLGLTNAGQLYDIQGGNTSTTYAGEGHIARASTPVDPTTGFSNGTVPQATLDTLGNILAACVDSGSTASSTSAQCSKLFANATSDGTTTSDNNNPTDTGTAAFNIAHYPAGTNNSSFVKNLMGIPTGNVPFSPNLTTNPNDFTIAITYTVPTSTTNSANLLNGPDSISIDGEGNTGVWITNFYGQPVKIFANTGFPDYTTNANLAGYGTTRSIALDLTGNAWLSVGQQSTGSYASKLIEVPVSPTSQTPSLVSPVPFTNLTWATVDQTGQYLFTSSSYSINKIDMYGANGAKGGNVSPTNQSSQTIWSNYDANGAFTACVQNGSGSVFTNTVDFQGTVYTVNNDKNAICTANSAGNEVNIYSGFNGTGMAGSVDYNAGAPRFWGVNGTTSSNGTQLQSFKATAFVEHNYANGMGSGNNGGLNGAYATAIDGLGNIWVGNQGGGVAAYNPTSGNFLSPANGFSPTLPGVSANGCFPAIDRAGDVWLAYAGSTSGSTTNVYEIIGAAAPTIGPVSVGLYNSAKTGTGTGSLP